MSSKATSQSEGRASGVDPGSGGTSSSRAPTTPPEVVEISQGNRVPTIKPAIVYSTQGEECNVPVDTTAAVDEFTVPTGYKRVGTRQASFMYSVGVYCT